MVSEYCLESLQLLVKEYDGEITYQKTAQEASKSNHLLEFTWNHTTLHTRSIDHNLTYLQTSYWTLERVEQMYHYFGDEVMIHLKFLRVDGKAISAGLPLIHYSTEARLNEIIHYHEEQGAAIANPHTYILEDGGRKIIDIDQLQFKELVDPYGLMNPGKMRAWLNKSKVSI